jgi:hypothetical protein
LSLLLFGLVAFQLSQSGGLGRRLNEYQTAAPDKFPLSPFVQEYAQNPPSKICSVSRALGRSGEVMIIAIKGPDHLNSWPQVG